MEAEAAKSPAVANMNQTLEVRFVNKHNAGSNKNVQELFWADIAQIGAKLISEKGEKGGLSKSRLAHELDACKLTPDDEMVAGAIYNNFEKLTKETFSLGDKKITEADFRRFTDRASTVEKNFVRVDDLTYWADDQGNLKRLSTDRTGSVTLSDLDKAQFSKPLTSEDRAMIAELKANFSSITKTGRIGKAEIDDYWKRAKDVPGYTEMASFYLHMRAIEANQNNPVAHRVFTDEKNPIKSITVDAVHQGYSGDCAIVAALACLSAYRPQEISSMIKRSGNELQVKFPVFKKAISIASPSSYELGLYLSEQNQSGYWPLAITKAFGESVYAKADPITKLKMNAESKAEWAGENGSIGRAIETLTGHDANFTATNEHSDDDLRNLLIKANQEKRIVILGTGKGSKPTVSGYRPAHAFSVMGVAKVNANDLSIKLRDPSIDGPKGTTTISLKDLKRNFDRVCEETTTKQIER